MLVGISNALKHTHTNNSMEMMNMHFFFLPNIEERVLASDSLFQLV
jgi:hypothetical protein